MAVQLSIKAVNANLVAKRFEDLTGDIKNISLGRIRGRLVSAQKAVSKYPPRYADEPPHHWASEDQRRYVMWAIRQGIITVPYVRTGKYGDSWAIVKTKRGYMLKSSYKAAKYMAGSARDPNTQYHIHKTRWMPLRTAVEKSVNELPKEIKDNIVMIAKRRGF
jgi:hypothetical protein